jgi:hypothetical protein
MGKALEAQKETRLQHDRKRLIAMIHIAKKDLGLNREEYEAVLEGATGETSCTKLNPQQLWEVLRSFENLGWKRKIKRTTQRQGKAVVRRFDPKNNDPRLSKIWKLWYLLADAGITQRSAGALNKFIKRQTGIDKMEWLETDQDFGAVIEALKSWYTRETGEILE